MLNVDLVSTDLMLNFDMITVALVTMDMVLIIDMVLIMDTVLILDLVAVTEG